MQSRISFVLRGACVGVAALFLCLAAVPKARAMVDQDANRIDDRIDRVQLLGWPAAFEDDNPAKRMRIGVFNGLPLRYAVYIRYDHHPTATDSSALVALGLPVKRYHSIDYVRSSPTYPQIQQIAAFPGVQRVEAVPMMYPVNAIATRTTRVRDSRGFRFREDETYFPSARSDLGLQGDGIVLAILDTGVNDAASGSYPGHVALQGKFLGGGNFFSGQPQLNTALDGSENPQDNGERSSEDHATHCAGISIGGGGATDYFTGVAPHARLVDCKVLSDAGVGFGAADALDWCIYNKNRLWAGLAPGSPYQGIDVISMSLGCIGCNDDGSDADAQMVNAAVDAGLVVVIAMGNDGAVATVTSPASADKAISVGASDCRKTITRDDDFVSLYSNEGPRLSDGDLDRTDEMKPSVVSPGGGDSSGAGILSADGGLTTDGTRYKELSGTSMATPHTAGIVALLRQAKPLLTPLQIRTILQNTAVHRRAGAKTAASDTAYTSVDPNYHAGWGWGTPDAYAAALEAMNPTVTQVVLIQIRPDVANNRMHVHWETQREFPHSGFSVMRAPDLNGAPGAYAAVNLSPIPGGSYPEIDKVANRHGYDYDDTDPALVIGQPYWYRLQYSDGSGVHTTPARRVGYGQRPIVATAFFNFTHNTSDNDLMVTIGCDRGRDPSLDYARKPDLVTQGLLIPNQDRDSTETGNATTVTIRHFFHIDFMVDDGAQDFVPPGNLNPWFFSVLEGGYVNRSGRLNDFSLFVPGTAGASTGTTYVSNSVKPQQTVEMNRTTLWIPESNPLVAVEAASFAAEGSPEGVRLSLDLRSAVASGEATVFRGRSADFDAAAPLVTAQSFNGSHYEYLDASADPLLTYWYWVQVRDAQGAALMSGPVVGNSGLVARTRASFARPNPAHGSTVLDYAIGRDVAGSGPVAVSITVHDVQGRVVRELEHGRHGMGVYRVGWDTKDGQGRLVGPGLYYLNLRVAGIQETRRVAVMR